MNTNCTLTSIKRISFGLSMIGSRVYFKARYAHKLATFIYAHLQALPNVEIDVYESNYKGKNYTYLVISGRSIGGAFEAIWHGKADHLRYQADVLEGKIEEYACVADLDELPF